MLSEYKQIYLNKANQIKDWKKMSKNELCEKYIENENNKEKAEAYFSAIVSKYWPSINRYYNASYNACTIYDCYDWLIDAITYALEKRRWEDSDSSIYKDKNGPDKVINRCMACNRYTHYQAINRQKRKDGFSTLSLEGIKDDYVNPYMIMDLTTDERCPNAELTFQDYIKTIFMKKDFFLCFLLDMIINSDVFIMNDEGIFEFKRGRIVKCFKQINDAYLNYFSSEYNLPIDDVICCYDKYVKNLSPTDIYQKLDFNTQLLKHDKFFERLLT